MCRFCSKPFFILLFATVLCALWDLSTSFRTGAMDAGPYRMFCRYFEGPFHGRQPRYFSQDSIKVSESIHPLLSKDGNVQPNTSSNPVNCYRPGQHYLLKIKADTHIRGVLVTAIDNSSLTDDKKHTMGSFPRNLLAFWRLQEGACVNSVTHSKALDNNTVSIPWQAPNHSHKMKQSVTFVYLLAYGYKVYTSKRRVFIVPPCQPCSETSSITASSSSSGHYDPSSITASSSSALSSEMEQTSMPCSTSLLSRSSTSSPTPQPTNTVSQHTRARSTNKEDVVLKLQPYKGL